MDVTPLDTVAISELKARLSHYLRAVQAGSELTVTDRGRPVARLVPVGTGAAQPDHVAELIATGAARPPLQPLPAAFRRSERPSDEESRALDFLLDERRDGR